MSKKDSWLFLDETGSRKQFIKNKKRKKE